jgi:hypothetical protein
VSTELHPLMDQTDRHRALAPSPTADATRLVEPLRTSPTANTPGRLVSSAERRGPVAAPGVLCPAPGFARLERLDDRVADGMGVTGSVAQR